MTAPTVFKAFPIDADTPRDLNEKISLELDYQDNSRDNQTRAYFAVPALKAFAERTGIQDEDQELAMSDLISDLHHLADALSLDWDVVLQRGDGHYQAEIRGEI